MLKNVFQMICNLFISLLLLPLSVIGTTNGSAPEPHCHPHLKVPRNTVFKASVMKPLKINCTVNLHECHRIPDISWCKIYGDECKYLHYSIDLTNEWKNTSQHEGIAFLVFLNISVEDAGLYRCRHGESSVSHAINVTVTADNEEEFTSLPTLSNTMPKILDNPLPKDDQQWLWLYVYICSGIAGLVVIIMTVTLLYAIRCQGRNLTRKNMYTETQNSDLFLHHPHLCPNSNLMTSVVYRV